MFTTTDEACLSGGSLGGPERLASPRAIYEVESDMADVSAILTAAAKAVEEANLPDDLRQAGFQKAIDLLTRGTEAGPAPAIPAIHAPTETGGRDLLAKIAARLRLTEQIVSDVYEETDGAIDVIVPAARFEARKAPAAKQIALLVAAARQGAELEEWTDVDQIRHFAEEYKKYDPNNFAATLKEMDDVFRVKQTGRTITLKLSRPGWDKAAELVQAVASPA
jgi:hypothetical protein